MFVGLLKSATKIPSLSVAAASTITKNIHSYSSKLSSLSSLSTTCTYHHTNKSTSTYRYFCSSNDLSSTITSTSDSITTADESSTTKKKKRSSKKTPTLSEDGTIIEPTPRKKRAPRKKKIDVEQDKVDLVSTDSSSSSSSSTTAVLLTKHEPLPEEIGFPSTAESIYSHPPETSINVDRFTKPYDVITESSIGPKVVMRAGAPLKIPLGFPSTMPKPYYFQQQPSQQQIQQQQEVLRPRLTPANKFNNYNINIYAGIDESGKGSVLGPLVVAIVVIDQPTSQLLRATGVKDSKALTSAQRENLYSIITEKAIYYKTKIFSASDIDQRRKVQTLNQIEMGIFMELIDGLKQYYYENASSEHLAQVMMSDDTDGDHADDSKPHHRITVEIDSIESNSQKFSYPLRQRYAGFANIVCEIKADMTYTSTAAASIVAKVTRDKYIENLQSQVGEPIGCGYPSDETTLSFIDRFYRANAFDHPEVRQSWKTISSKRPAPNQVILPKITSDQQNINNNNDKNSVIVTQSNNINNNINNNNNNFQNILLAIQQDLGKLAKTIESLTMLMSSSSSSGNSNNNNNNNNNTVDHSSPTTPVVVSNTTTSTRKKRSSHNNTSTSGNLSNTLTSTAPLSTPPPPLPTTTTTNTNINNNSNKEVNTEADNQDEDSYRYF
ncbi:hypothetical protein DFA_11462 [Cavenderia fasciculata]|uniref:Ribonuclease n=1 Tax=Cavenderia fasciculata TaxID=261658 RepID=F4QD20_CACFS|nr:uncharacterized protein DFA_11462 [Cavenderia fasciculata]EGG13701.1 hypothetical protein DFA_11462 [Cavenderia fasciculata]|eukprot:XP_004350405.1 hypothetical protein DFA_11462 [Cavenderia fasciculata]